MTHMTSTNQTIKMVEGMEVNDVLVGRILEIRSAGILNIKDGSIDQEASGCRWSKSRFRVVILFA